ncbi:MAG: alpha/beta fold hydrolase [Pseudomonadota bacterium]
MTDDINDLIDTVYETVLDTGRFDELIALAADGVANDASRDRFVALRQTFEQHVVQAEKLLSRLPTAERGTGTSQPVFSLTRSGRIEEANEAALRLFDLSTAKSIDDLPEVGDAAPLFHAFAAGRADHSPILRLTRKDTGKPYIFRIESQDRQSEAPGFRAVGADTLWSEAAGEAMAALYGFSPSERDVLGLLMDGLSPTEAAERRGRSLETIRQQIKAMIAKSACSGLQELMQIARAVALAAGRRSRLWTESEDWFDRRSLHLSDGRRLDYIEQGDPDGTPVVFLHGCLCGNRFPPSAHAFFQSTGIRLIAPARPWHGQSDPLDPMVERPDTYAADLAALADHLGLGAFALLSFDVGSIVALCVGAQLADRLDSVTCVSAQPPIRSFRDFAAAPPQQRIFALLPRISVPLLSYMAKVGDRRLKSDGIDGFATTVFANAPADLKACEDPELLRLFWEGHLFHVEKGSDGFINDCRLVASSWKDRFSAFNTPLRFIHGDQNQSVPLSRVRDFALQANAPLSVVADAGHSLIFSHWRDVFDLLPSGADSQA